MNRRRPQTAAIFDLDRTLIAGPSAPAFSRGLDAAGIEHALRCPGAALVSGIYRALGETALTAQTARLAARATAGWPEALVRDAAKAAAEELEQEVQPYAPGVIEEHRQAGRVLVMATTSPEPLVTPFAERLGFDAVSPRAGRPRTASYTGEVDGPLVWGRGKLEAVRSWAAEAGVDLRASYAYSDSYYDAPLLDAVRHPVAVNADVRLVALARLKGWPLRHFDLPEGVLKIAGRELQDWTRPLQRPELLANVSLDVDGVDKIPKSGPVIVVFNHRSYFDATVVGAVLGTTGRSFRFLGKKEVFDAPVIGFLAKLAGGIRVDRASGSDEPLEHAIRALSAGEAVALAPEGTIRRGLAFFDPVLKGRWGAARLAQATGAPVIPLGLWGTEKVWPRSARLPKISFVRPARGPRARRRSREAEAPQPRRRHQADHGGDRRPAPARGAQAQDADARGARLDVPARVPRATRRESPTADPARTRERAAVAKERPQREQRFERRMSDAEALMWNVEKDPWLNPSGGTLMLLDRPLDIEHFRAQIAATVAEIPRLRERVVPGLGRFSPPVWRPDPEFDLEYHVRPVAVPSPGDERQLLDFVATLYQDPYDRTRPLWIFYAIEGLEFDRGALVWKIHHSVADGIGAGRIAEAFLQPVRKVPDLPSVDLEAVVAAAVEADRAEHGGDSVIDSVRDTVTHTMRRQAGIARRALGEVAMLGADPLRARDTAQGVVRSVRQVTSQFGSGSAPGRPDERGGTGARGQQGFAAVEVALAAPPARTPDVRAGGGAGRRAGVSAARSTTGSSPAS